MDSRVSPCCREEAEQPSWPLDLFPGEPIVDFQPSKLEDNESLLLSHWACTNS